MDIICLGFLIQLLFHSIYVYKVVALIEINCCLVVLKAFILAIKAKLG